MADSGIPEILIQEFKAISIDSHTDSKSDTDSLFAADDMSPPIITEVLISSKRMGTRTRGWSLPLWSSTKINNIISINTTNDVAFELIIHSIYGSNLFFVNNNYADSNHIEKITRFYNPKNGIHFNTMSNHVSEEYITTIETLPVDNSKIHNVLLESPYTFDIPEHVYTTSINSICKDIDTIPDIVILNINYNYSKLMETILHISPKYFLIKKCLPAYDLQPIINVGYKLYYNSIHKSDHSYNSADFKETEYLTFVKY